MSQGLDDMEKCGMYISDLPIHDASRDLALMAEQRKYDLEQIRNLEVKMHSVQGLELRKRCVAV